MDSLLRKTIHIFYFIPILGMQEKTIESYLKLRKNIFTPNLQLNYHQFITQTLYALIIFHFQIPTRLTFKYKFHFNS